MAISRKVFAVAETIFERSAWSPGSCGITIKRRAPSAERRAPSAERRAPTSGTGCARPEVDLPEPAGAFRGRVRDFFSLLFCFLAPSGGRPAAPWPRAARSTASGRLSPSWRRFVLLPASPAETRQFPLPNRPVTAGGATLAVSWDIEALQPKSLPPSTAPIATGWSDTCRAGLKPAEGRHPSTAYWTRRVNPPSEGHNDR